jgi:hypothetical protein
MGRNPMSGSYVGPPHTHHSTSSYPGSPGRDRRSPCIGALGFRRRRIGEVQESEAVQVRTIRGGGLGNRHSLFTEVTRSLQDDESYRVSTPGVEVNVSLRQR